MKIDVMDKEVFLAVVVSAMSILIFIFLIVVVASRCERQRDVRRAVIDCIEDGKRSTEDCKKIYEDL